MEIKKKLLEEKAEATWKALKPHCERDALILVSRELAIEEAGVAVATDDQKSVGSWIEKGLLAKPSKGQIDAWDKEKLKFFWMLIVRPFVLAQELTPEEQKALIASQNNPADGTEEYPQ